MTVKIKIPLILRKYINKKEYIETENGRICEILTNIAKDYPILASKIFSKNNILKENVILLLDGDNPKIFSNNEKKIKNGEKLIIIVFESGG